MKKWWHVLLKPSTQHLTVLSIQAENNTRSTVHSSAGGYCNKSQGWVAHKHWWVIRIIPREKEISGGGPIPQVIFKRHRCPFKRRPTKSALSYLFERFLHLILMHLMGDDFVSTAMPARDSCSVYHWATGLRGLSSISIQWSLPRPMQLLPIAQHPITSFAPTLK